MNILAGFACIVFLDFTYRCIMRRKRKSCLLHWISLACLPAVLLDAFTYEKQLFMSLLIGLCLGFSKNSEHWSGTTIMESAWSSVLCLVGYIVMLSSPDMNVMSFVFDVCRVIISVLY